MSGRPSEVVSLFGVGAILVLSSCSDKVPDAQWAKTVPGFYDGSQAGFRETLALAPKGTFQHQVYFNRESALSETGKWSFDVQSGIVLVEPFTSFFDKENKKIKTQGVLHDQDAFGVMRYGTAAEKISQSIDFDFVLVKRLPEPAASTNSVAHSNNVNGQPNNSATKK